MQGNTGPHTATLTTSLLADFDWDVFSHCPYSPNLELSNNYLFLGIKCKFGVHQFATDVELRAAITKITAYLEESWYTAGIERLVYHYNKMLDSFGDYVEK